MHKKIAIVVCVLSSICGVLSGCNPSNLTTDDSPKITEENFSLQENTMTTFINLETGITTTTSSNNSETKIATVTSAQNENTIERELLNNRCSVFVESEELSSDYHAYMNTEKMYAVLPFVKIIHALGGSVIWQSNVEASIQLDGRDYVLNVLNTTLIDVESGKDYFQLFGEEAPYSPCFEFTGTEYIIHSDYLQCFFLDTNVLMKLDFNTLAVFISKNTTAYDKEKNCKVFVEGKELSLNYCAYMNTEKKYAVLPFTNIIQSLGGSVTWQTNFESSIQLDGRNYVLDVLNTTLIDVESGKDYLQMILGGNTHYPCFEFTGDEYMMDSDFLSYFFSDTNIRMEMDFETFSVYINRK